MYRSLTAICVQYHEVYSIMLNSNLLRNATTSSNGTLDSINAKRVEIRKYKPEDRDVALEMCVKGLVEELDPASQPMHWKVATDYNEVIKSQFNNVPAMVNSKNGGSLFTAVDKKGRIVGTIGLRVSDDDKLNKRAELVRMTVAREHRGEGVGKSLLSFVIDYATTELGCESIWLSTIRSLSKAYQLYRKFGFNETRYVETGDSDLDTLDMGWCFEMEKRL